ncbi:sulfite exporter TauE/SafE family protein [Xylophilus sp.]|uniref:sulfite exporter TauE/SafE family protein n=1 Tax=Xylophilus sp. TaxID=2653893 RepID=UPI0013BC7755|nr:sulfite exporter TauE/SafE family protein [Xylophilus sp.]KAF1047188.1 MAG: hypothetical protein GAK38_02069 [Xylophilus sp.]
MLSPIDFFSVLQLGWAPLAAITLALAGAYVIFGIAGFGTALVTGPVLAQFVPLSVVVPLLALLDLAAAAGNVVRRGRQADRAELMRLLPWMAAGSLAGAALLLSTRPQALLLALGLFACGYALHALRRPRAPKAWTPRAALPFGLVGGVFSALFGSGGFLYAIYLGGRVADKERLRVTQSTLIGLSTLTRVVLFAGAGVYADVRLLLLAAVLAPAMLVGTAIGRRLVLRLSREQFLAVVHGVVLCSGVALLMRWWLA